MRKPVDRTGCVTNIGPSSPKACRHVTHMTSTASRCNIMHLCVCVCVLTWKFPENIYHSYLSWQNNVRAVCVPICNLYDARQFFHVGVLLEWVHVHVNFVLLGYERHGHTVTASYFKKILLMSLEHLVNCQENGWLVAASVSPSKQGRALWRFAHYKSNACQSSWHSLSHKAKQGFSALCQLRKC